MLGGGAADPLVGVHAGELPVGPGGDVAGVVVDLGLVGGLLFFQVGGHAGVGRDPTACG